MGRSYPRSAFLAIVITLAALLLPAEAQNKKKKPAPNLPQDAIEVVGHIPMTNGPVTAFLPTQHYSSYYLYVEHDGGKAVTLIDITKANQPVVLANITYPLNDGASASIFAVTGTAAVITEQQSKNPGVAAAPRGQIVRIMDFSDAQHPKIAREFSGVTTISRDDRRGLIFLADREGIWILRQSLATDPEVEKEYERYIMYNR
jgi:hypothetical protein